MIVGIGTDIVSIDRIAAVLKRHGQRFVNRILTPEERARYQRTNERARPGHFAKRWAAKEAFAKAIGTGIHPPFTWQSITVGRDAMGKPLVIPDEKMAKHLKSLGVTDSHISLTDDAGVAVAFVVLEGLKPHASRLTPP
jgi:holo-[acyl-carrier protein] synthase